MVTRAPSRGAVAVAAGFCLSCVGLIIFVWVQFGGSVPLAAQGYRVSAVFSESGLLVSNEDVRIAGVNVGKVVSVSSQGSKSLVVMDLNPRFAPIPTDTRAILREKTLLGEAYVDLSTGNRNGPKVPDGGTIPNDQVQPTQQLDQVLNAFTPPVQHNFEQYLEGTGSSLQGQGEDLNDAFGNFDPTVTELDEVAGVLNAEGGDLRAAIRNSGTVLTALGDRGADLQGLIHSGDSVFTATAAENRSLTQGIDAFPAFLTQLNTSLGKLNTTLAVAKPSLRVLAPVAPLLKPALVDTVGLTGTFERFLKAAAPSVLRETLAVAPVLTRFVSTLPPLVNATLPAAEQIVPVINVISDYRSQLVLGMVDLAAILNAQTTASTTSSADGIPAGQAKYLRQILTLGQDSVFGQTTRSPDERSSTYFPPGALASVGTSDGEGAASCAGATGTGNVPCHLEPSYAWGHGIATGYYPRVTAAKP